METQRIMQEMVDFPQSTFDAAFEMAAGLQDQARDAAKAMLDQARFASERSLQACDEWAAAGHRSRQAFKTAMDDNFKAFSAAFEK
jgi:hypothetical protein